MILPGAVIFKLTRHFTKGENATHTFVAFYVFCKNAVARQLEDGRRLDNDGVEKSQRFF
jgi:hypothetical protein